MSAASPTRQQLDEARSLARFHAWKVGRGAIARGVEADDLIQAAMVVVVLRYDRWPKSGRPWSSWAWDTTRGAILDELRKMFGRSETKQRFINGQVSLDEMLSDDLEIERIDSGARGALVWEDERFEDVDEAARRAAVVVREMAELPLNLASALEMRVVEDMTYREIGELMGLTESRAFQLVAEAKRRLVERLSPQLLAA